MSLFNAAGQLDGNELEKLAERIEAMQRNETAGGDVQAGGNTDTETFRLFNAFGELDGRELEKLASAVEAVNRLSTSANAGYIQTGAGTVILPSSTAPFLQQSTGRGNKSFRLFNSAGQLDGNELERLADEAQRQVFASSGADYIQTSAGTVILPLTVAAPITPVCPGGPSTLYLTIGGATGACSCLSGTITLTGGNNVWSYSYIHGCGHPPFSATECTGVFTPPLILGVSLACYGEGTWLLRLPTLCTGQPGFYGVCLTFINFTGITVTPSPFHLAASGSQVVCVSPPFSSNCLDYDDCLNHLTASVVP